MDTRKKMAVGIVTTALLLGSLAIALLLARGAGSAFAANNGTDHFGPFAGSSTDGGSCGAPWANDTFNRFFSVHDNGDGTFSVTEDFKDGTFTTIGPVSPGKCETTDSHHGTTVPAGVTGSLHGFESGTVTGGTYNPNGCSAVGADCTTTAGFIAAVFVTTASFTVTSFNFEYDSSNKSLAYHHWSDKYNPGQAIEQFIGDIATQ